MGNSHCYFIGALLEFTNHCLEQFRPTLSTLWSINKLGLKGLMICINLSAKWICSVCPPQTCIVRAWDTSRPLLFCPAMNTAMWQHPITAKQVATLQGFGYVEIPCIYKKLVCGDEGNITVTPLWILSTLRVFPKEPLFLDDFPCLFMCSMD